MGKRNSGKTENKHFRCSVEEAIELKKQAKIAGLDESKYLRSLLFSVPSDYPEIREKLDKLIHEIHKIGVNINQIAYACNVNPAFYGEEKEKLMYYMKECRRLLLEVVSYCNHEDDAHVAGKNGKQE